MDVISLSRLQFAVATYFHFLFVPLTLGLSIMLAIMQSLHLRTGNEEYRSMAKFWGKLFLINFVVGVVTGITLEFQFGTNWSRYSRYVGDIFGPLLAVEATVAFFLESTFVAVWAFGWKKLSPRLHTDRDLVGRDRIERLGFLDSDRQLLDAEPRRLRHEERQAGAGRFLRRNPAALRLADHLSYALRAPTWSRASSSWASAPTTSCASSTLVSSPALSAWGSLSRSSSPSSYS